MDLNSVFEYHWVCSSLEEWERKLRKGNGWPWDLVIWSPWEIPPKHVLLGQERKTAGLTFSAS